MIHHLVAILFSLGAPLQDGWVSLFNGRDLAGWVNLNCAPATFTVMTGEDGEPVIHCSGQPTGLLRTATMYENFVLELEWMHMLPEGNAGLFVWSDGVAATGTPFARSIEVQVMLTADVHDEQGKLLYTGQGDVFSIHGATMIPDRPHPLGWSRCLPSARHTKGSGEWNHYRVTCDGGNIKLAVNGVEVSGGSAVSPRQGYICLESEGTPVRFRNIRIQELPKSQPALESGQCAIAAEGFASIMGGDKLEGWGGVGATTEGSSAPPLTGWHQDDWILVGESNTSEVLATREQYSDYDLSFDWRFPDKPVQRELGVFNADGTVAHGSGHKEATLSVADAGARFLLLRGEYPCGAVALWCNACGSGCLTGVRADATLPRETRAAAMPRVRADRAPGGWNHAEVSLRGNRATVRLNGLLVIESAEIPGMLARGPIGFSPGEGRIDLANIAVRTVEPQATK
ncbi:MAG: DUF1080 domain-containing protein [Phycisphaerales bacterium]|nr:DUF1080 domain-containing protein [Phycisphaerales bacterium]